MTKKQYEVSIYEQPFIYTVEAENKEQAELLAMKIYNNSDYESVSKIITKLI